MALFISALLTYFLFHGFNFRFVSSAKMVFEKPVVKAQEAEEEEEDAELIDPQVQLREECSQKKDCAAYQEKLQECNDRVNSRKKTEETCVEELFDFMHCVDHCVSKKLFTVLK